MGDSFATKFTIYHGGNKTSEELDREKGSVMVFFFGACRNLTAPTLNSDVTVPCIAESR